MKYQYEDIAIHYEVIGEGRPVVMLHGLGCDMELMRACMEPVFSKRPGYQRIYVDLPGMGRSGTVLSYASADRILEVLTGFIDQVVPGKFLIMGESYGGYLARGILSNDIEKVDGLMLLCPVIVPGREGRVLPPKNAEFHDRQFLDTLDTTEREQFCDYAVLADEDIYRRYKTEVAVELSQESEAFIYQLKDHYRFSFDVDEKIRTGRFERPALFVCGRQDICVGYEDALKLVKDYPRGTFALVDVAGHNLQLEQPKLLEALVENWLLRVEKYI
ncbi:MAG: alpha/beta hydrolase [Coprococcus sp.]|nr:alpha/beta hydrolase [Coprococcus sp.]